MINNIIKDLGHKCITEGPSKIKTFFTITLLKLLEDVQNKTYDKIIDSSGNLQGEGVKFIIPSNIIDIYTRLERLLGLKVSCHTNTQTEATNLIGELYQRGEIQIEQQYRNALNKLST